MMTIREFIIIKAFGRHGKTENKSVTIAQDFCDKYKLIKSSEEWHYYMNLYKKRKR